MVKWTIMLLFVLHHMLMVSGWLLSVWIVACLHFAMTDMKGIYANLEHGIKGAPGAMTIHCDKNQNVDQNTNEWNCQWWGEEPTPLQTRQRFHRWNAASWSNGCFEYCWIINSRNFLPLLPILCEFCHTCKQKGTYHSSSWWACKPLQHPSSMFSY